MPKSHRDFLKRSLGYVLANHDRILQHTLTIKREFDEAAGVDTLSPNYEAEILEAAKTSSHAAYAILLNNAMTMTLMAQAAYEDFAMHAWGGVPDRIERWTNTGQDARNAEGD